MCCVAELEDILVNEYDAELCCLPDVPGNIGSDVTVFCCLIAFYQIYSIESILARFKNGGNRVVIYCFDCWDVPTVLYSRRRELRDLLRPSLRIEQLVDRLCLPFRSVCAALKPQHRALARHVPLGVDATLVNGFNRDRPISVLAYGRQPPDLIRAIAIAMNDPGSPLIFHHTDHSAVGGINDRLLHRMHFWKLAQSSRIAITYDAKLTSPHRVPISIVGQRFYESLAAGCALAGRRPATDEADELLDWPDSVIELPDEPAEAVAALIDLSSDTKRLSAIRERNVEETRARHDWRQRIARMLDDQPQG